MSIKAFSIHIAFSALVMLLLASHTPLASQSFTATVTGNISDSVGAALPGVNLTLTNIETNRTHIARTDKDGDYIIAGLVPGSYTLAAELRGFRKYEQSGITLAVDQTARLDLTLVVGSINETVRVTADVAVINTETGAKGEVITGREITDLPLNGRDFAELAFLTAGVIEKAQGGQGGFASINGARSDSVNYVIDGVNNQSLRLGGAQARPSVDAIREFKVQTNAYAADFGRLGSGLINMALKSGTNQFHGSLFEFVRNDLFDSRGFFDERLLKLRRNQFGGTVGGPVRLPQPVFGPLSYEGRDQTFFFFSYEGTRERRGQTRIGRVPTLPERDGDFSASTAAITDPFNQNRPFPNRRIPRERWSPVAVQLLSFYPLPNFSRGANNYITDKQDNDDADRFIVKLDQRLRQTDTLTVHALIDRLRNTDPFGGSIFPGFGNLTDLGQQQWGFSYTHVFSPSWTNEVRLGFGRTNNLQHTVNQGIDFAGRLGIPGVTKDPALTGFPRFTVRGIDDLGDANNQPLDFIVNNFQFFDSMSVTRGKHYLRFGADIIRTQFFQLFTSSARGVFNFLGRWTGEPVADLLLGLPESANRQVTTNKNYLFTTSYGFFAQDDLRVASRLTLNLGLRYDLLKPPVEKFDRISNFIPELGRVATAGEAGFPRSVVELDRNNFAPRFGFAWRPAKGHQTVVRGGYGIFYNQTVQNPIRLLLSNNFPFVILQRFNRQANNPSLLTLSSPFPESIARLDGVDTPAGVAFRDPTSYLQQYNLTIERELLGGTAIEVGYVGSKGNHLGRQYNVNQAIRNAQGQTPFPRPYPGFSDIDYLSFGSASNYHALQATLRKRFTKGLSFRVNFALSKSIDDASQISGISDGGFSGAQDSQNLRAERGLSDFDRRKVFTADFLYTLPLGRGQRWLNGAFWSQWLGAWQLNGILRFQDGQPFTPQLANINFSLGESRRPDRLGSGKLADPMPELWFNIKDFVAVPRGAFRFGNSGRNVVTGPGSQRVDLSLFKNIVLAKEQRLQLRVEAFNLLNHANFFLPARSIDLPNAGAITQAQPGRELQLALKYVF